MRKIEISKQFLDCKILMDGTEWESLKPGLAEPILDWIFINTKGRFHAVTLFTAVYFEFDDDAMKFKLTWG